jgi:hypothetical protein
MNLLQYPTSPMNDLAFVMFLGVGYPLIDLIFSRSTAIPSSNIPFIKCMKVAGAFVHPNDTTTNS